MVLSRWRWTGSYHMVSGRRPPIRLVALWRPDVRGASQRSPSPGRIGLLCLGRLWGPLPELPAPSEVPEGTKYACEPEFLVAYVGHYSRTTGHGSDAYWGGKGFDIPLCDLWMAEELELDAHLPLRNTLRTALVEWRPDIDGETEHDYAAYDT